MIVYQTNPQGIYIGPVRADESPLEPGVWLIPGGCVETPPPAIPNGMMAVWDGNAWDLMPLPTEQTAPSSETPVPTTQELVAQFTSAIDGHVEATARARQYNGAAHLASYVASTVPAWSAEALAFIAWRDQVWLFALSELAQIQSGTKPLPAVADLIASLPVIQWPAT